MNKNYEKWEIESEESLTRERAYFFLVFDKNLVLSRSVYSWFIIGLILVFINHSVLNLYHSSNMEGLPKKPPKPAKNQNALSMISSFSTSEKHVNALNAFTSLLTSFYKVGIHAEI
mgnify:CR=1 FL=1